MGKPFKTVFLTGATGFLGSHLCYAFLQSGHRVLALARHSKTTPARDRVLEVLGHIAPERDGLSRLVERLEVIHGDIAEPQLGLGQDQFANLAQSVDDTWHSAASLSFLEEDRKSIFEMNVGGTEAILDFVVRTESRRLHHISTAYVSGRRSGVVLEDEADVGQTFKNPYEESKCRAEMLVADARQQRRVRASVYRPSIIIGDSQSGRATHFHGVYAFIRGLWAVTRRLRQRQKGATDVNLPLRVMGSENTTLNFVPINYVTDAMVALSQLASTEGKTFHLTNPKPTPNHLWLNIVCDQLGVQGIRLVGNDAFLSDPMTRIETTFHRQMAFYCPYLSGEAQFDCSNVVESLANTPIRCPDVTPEFARMMTGWYIDELNSNQTAS